jgi:hypothetical protein
MNFSKYQRTISLAVLMLLGLGNTLPAVGSGSVSADRLTKQGTNHEVLLAQVRRKRKPIKFSNLNVKAPTYRKSRYGAMRGGVCPDNQVATGKNIQKDMIAILPPESQSVTASKKDTTQLTTFAHPTILFDLPENSPTTASFYLRDQNDKEVYSALDFPLPNKTSKNAGGVVILDLAEVAKTQKVPELKVGESYIWQVTLSCGSNASKKTPTISGWIRRIDPKIALGNQLEASIINQNKLNASLVIADELEKIEDPNYRVYAANGIWYSAVNTLAKLIATNPQDSQLREEWEELLTSVNLTEIAKKPIIGSVTIKKFN